MSRETELLEKVEEWQNKAKRETDPFNKYVSIFTAYNIFYNLYAKSRSSNIDFSQGDSRRATDTIALVETEQLFESLKTDLKEYLSTIPVFREEYWPRPNSRNRIPLSQTLRESFEAGNKNETIDLLIKWLYKVRCNLVHGEKSYHDDNQRKLLEISTKLLDKILKHSVARYKQTCGLRD